MEHEGDIHLDGEIDLERVMAMTMDSHWGTGLSVMCAECAEQYKINMMWSPCRWQQSMDMCTRSRFQRVNGDEWRITGSPAHGTCHHAELLIHPRSCSRPQLQLRSRLAGAKSRVKDKAMP